MKNFKRLLCIVMALVVMGAFAFTAIAAGNDGKVDVETENNKEILDMTHLDVKASAKYYAEIDGEQVVLDASVVPSSIVVTVVTPKANLNYSFANYKVYTLVEAGMTEYRIVLDGTDGALLTAIDWDGASFRMKNVYVSARLVMEDVPAVLAAEMDETADGKYYVDVTVKYNGLQECTSHNGLRSEGHCGVISGVDLYLGNVPGLSVETPVPETTAPEATEPEQDPTCPDPTCPTCPDPTCPTWPDPTCPTWPDPTCPTCPSEPEVTEPEATEPETTEPETSEPETTEPETTEPETSEPETSEPETTEPDVDDVPDTGDSSNKTMIMILMVVSALGMAATAVVINKMKYVGKWQ